VREEERERVHPEVGEDERVQARRRQRRSRRADGEVAQRELRGHVGAGDDLGREPVAPVAAEGRRGRQVDVHLREAR
jgi:hypothetical protein